MAEEVTPDAPDQPADKPDTGPPAEPDWKAEAEKFKALARKQEERAKANAKAVSELDQLKAATMTDLEKAIKEAKTATKAEVLAEVGTARAADAIRFSVGDRLPETELESLLEDLNLARFLTDEGAVNKEKVTEYIGRIAPVKSNGVPDLGQGPRGGKVVLDDSPRGLITAALEANEAARKH